MPEALDGLLLVRPQRPAVLDEVDGVRLAVDVPGEVLGGPAQLQQGLLDLPALGGVHGHRVGVEPGTDQRDDPLGPQDLLEHRPVGAGQDQPVDGVLGEGEAAVARHGLGDVDEQRVRDGVAGELDERVDDLLGVVPRGPGVPQAERGDPVRVDVLGGPLELGEGGDGPARGTGELVVDLEEECFVALDDERPVHKRPFPTWGGCPGADGQTSSLPYQGPGVRGPDRPSRPGSCCVRHLPVSSWSRRAWVWRYSSPDSRKAVAEAWNAS